MSVQESCLRGGQHQGRAFRDQTAGRCSTPNLFRKFYEC
jgi:hypothetical protein